MRRSEYNFIIILSSVHYPVSETKKKPTTSTESFQGTIFPLFVLRNRIRDFVGMSSTSYMEMTENVITTLFSNDGRA